MATISDITGTYEESVNEKTPLLQTADAQNDNLSGPPARAPFHKRFVGAVVGMCRVIGSAILAPGRYVVACFYDEEGNFSLAMPIYRIGRRLTRKQPRPDSHTMALAHDSSNEKADEVGQDRRSRTKSQRPSKLQPENKQPFPTTDSGYDTEKSAVPKLGEDTPSQRTRSKTGFNTNSGTDDSDAGNSKRGNRIKIVSPEALRQRKIKKELLSPPGDGTFEPALTVHTIKSPTGPLSTLKLTKYPRAPAPPRPLIPRRQPSYSPSSGEFSNQKTLIIDLDETLIHSMAKGGRMSTGHMVEVKLQTAVGAGGAIIGPQVPILYYVHKRPHCDEFLRKISKWYNLIVFTASVQEYADPVIDWLELERKYFSARYYRQHCTYRNGAYIKDLSQVEPDLSKVMILDNSPMSYIFHEDNAIPIEGWISDPTDNDLLHLVPLLEGLQYTTDVRALLALRLGEATT